MAPERRVFPIALRPPCACSVMLARWGERRLERARGDCLACVAKPKISSPDELVHTRLSASALSYQAQKPLTGSGAIGEDDARHAARCCGCRPPRGVEHRETPRRVPLAPRMPGSCGMSASTYRYHARHSAHRTPGGGSMDAPDAGHSPPSPATQPSHSAFAWSGHQQSDDLVPPRRAGCRRHGSGGRPPDKMGASQSIILLCNTDLT